MKAFGLILLPLSVLPFFAVKGDVIREHEAYLIARNPRAPLNRAPGPPLPGHAPAPSLDARIRPTIPLSGGANITLGTTDGSVLLELTRQATSEGRRVFADVNGDGVSDVTIGAGPAGVRIVACQTSVAALASAGSGRRADGGTAVHLPAAIMGTAPRIVVHHGDPTDRTCGAPSFAHAPPVALPEAVA